MSSDSDEYEGAAPPVIGGISTFDEDTLAAGELLFCQPCTFLKGVVNIAGLPGMDLPEVAFAGRSNVGKSSLINALVRQKGLARTSNTPGRTQEINYFTIGEQLYLVDMPGYGYAKASKTSIKGWTKLIHDYLRGRASLSRVFMLIDARHGPKKNDEEIMALLDESAVSYQAVLTKIDKLKTGELTRVIETTLACVSKHPAAFPEIIATSSQKGTGLADLRASVLVAAGLDMKD